MRPRLLRAIAAGLALLTVGVAGARLERLADERGASEELLYLPNGKLLRVASLGQAPLVADLFYVWAIQYYSNYETADRGRYVEHVFGNVIAELDPHYIDAYWLGALILSLETHDLDAALRLLDKGFRHNPDQWVLPYLAAWECYDAGRMERATHYFDVAARVPNAPAAVLRLRAGVASRAGQLEQGLELWRDVLADPRADAASIAIAERQIADLESRIAVRDLEAIVARFRSETGRVPRGWDALVAAGYLGGHPHDTQGRPFVLDPADGSVRAPTSRVLRDSSSGASRETRGSAE